MLLTWKQVTKFSANPAVAGADGLFAPVTSTGFGLIRQTAVAVTSRNLVPIRTVFADTHCLIRKTLLQFLPNTRPKNVSKSRKSANEALTSRHHSCSIGLRDFDDCQQSEPQCHRINFFYGAINRSGFSPGLRNG